MVIGRVDTGKSTFCRHLASVALEKGLKVGIVDADVGQSWIGPPTTVGMKIVEGKPAPALFPDSFYFVGSVSPGGHLLQAATGTKRMIEAAVAAGAELVIIDTTGFVDGGIGRALKSSKIDLIRPDHIVCFQRGSELETLIKGFEQVCSVHRLEPSRSVQAKSKKSRSAYRQEQFNRYFSRCTIQEIPFSELRGQRTIFLNGRRANDSELKNLSEIVDGVVLYAEWSFKGLFIVTADAITDLIARKLRSHLSIDELSVNIPEKLQRLVTALIDEHGEPICLATIENMDFNQGILSLRCKKDAAKLARAIQFSDFQLPIVENERILGE